MPSRNYQVNALLTNLASMINLTVCIMYLGNELEQLFKDAPSVELPCELLACGDLTVLELAMKTDTVPSRCE